MPPAIREEDWNDLLRLIKSGKCTPFIGAGASAPTLPLARDVARCWSKEFSYPLADREDLARVAQFVALERYDMKPKELMEELIAEHGVPEFEADQLEPHALLADLGLPLYITTNYDDFMLQALKSRDREPRRDHCRWNNHPAVLADPLDPDFEPTVANPLVYHLHGRTGIPQSMVLTESDYLDFLTRLGRERIDGLLPTPVRNALPGCLMFIGYSLNDWSFRVLFRGFMRSLEATLGYFNIAVQLPPDDLEGEGLERAKRYLDSYLDEIQRAKVRVYWGDARTFTRELRKRWDAANGGN